MASDLKGGNALSLSPNWSSALLPTHIGIYWGQQLAFLTQVT